MSTQATPWPIMDRAQEAIHEMLEELMSRTPSPSKPQLISRRPPAYRSERFDSRCLLCGHIYYREMRLVCSKCSGRCRLCPHDELALSGRHSNAEGW